MNIQTETIRLQSEGIAKLKSIIDELVTASREALDILDCVEVEATRVRGLKPARGRLRKAIADAQKARTQTP